MTLVFVYGSLRRGQTNHRILEGSAMVATARTLGRFRLVDLGAYPALLPGGTTAVVGEVYEVDGPTLERLDRLEGHPHYYRRELIELDDRQIAYVYVFVADVVERACEVPSGDWVEHREKNQ